MVDYPSWRQGARFSSTRVLSLLVNTPLVPDVRALSLVLGSQFAVSFLTVFCFRWPSASAKRARIARHLVKSIPYDIWIFRNRATFQNGREDHRAIIRYVRNDLKQRFFLDSKRFCSISLSRSFASRRFLCRGEWTSPRYNLVVHLNPCNLFVRVLFAMSAIRRSP